MCSPYNQALQEGVLPSQHPSTDWFPAGHRGGSEVHTTSSILIPRFSTQQDSVNSAPLLFLRFYT